MDSTGWDERYRTSGLLWGQGPNVFLASEVADLTPGTALDVACGEGRNAIWLAEQGWRATGVDFSPVALSKAASLAAERGVEVAWLQADVTRWDPPSSYDLVVLLYLHLPAPLRHDVFRRFASAVAPGGTFLVVAHDLSNLTEGHGGPQDAEVLYGPEDVAHDVEGNVHVVRAERVRRAVDTPDGPVEAVDLLVRGRARS